MITEKPIIDCHAHVFPSKIAASAIASISAFYQLPMTGLGTIQDLSSSHRQAGITHRVISSTATRPEQVKTINRFMSRCHQQDRSTIALGTLHPDQTIVEMHDTLDQIVATGLRGVKLHPDFQCFPADAPFVIAAARAMAERHLVLLIHAGDPRQNYSNPEQISQLASACPNTMIIAAHLGGWRHWKDAARLLTKWENLSVDTSSSLPFLTHSETVSCIQAFGAHRVLFGTDYPMWRPAESLARFLALPLTRDEQQMILWDNGARLFQVL